MDDISIAIEAVKNGLPQVECKLNEPLKNHTSFRVGGPVRVMFFPKKAEELAELCGILSRSDIKPLIIGNGTNLLADDGKTLEIAAVKTTGIAFIKQTGETEITAGAGASLSKLASFARDCGLSGLEFAHGIPGTLGGSVLMNAGAYGREMKDAVISTNAFDYCSSYTLYSAEHRFEYRNSRFSETGEIILSSTVSLQKEDKEKITAKMDELQERRKESQPLDLPSAGSTFKRPKNRYAAELIDQAGLKGCSVGGAKVSEKHAGFIVNDGGATFADIMAVIEHIRATVFKMFGVELEPEVKIIRG